jgi:hypothetical protein
MGKIARYRIKNPGKPGLNDVDPSKSFAFSGESHTSFGLAQSRALERQLKWQKLQSPPVLQSPPL